MIRFLSEWDNYPQAILHLSTKNKSFVEMAGIYKKMGKKNHAWHLALFDRELEKVDPFDPDISEENIARVTREIRNNPMYFFREIMRVPPKAGVSPSLFRANRGNLALIWLFFVHVMVFMIQPRQTGKSLTVGALMRGLISFWVNHTKVNHINKDDGMRQDIVRLIKEIETYLPFYLQMLIKKDEKNSESISVKRLGNRFATAVGNASVKLADKVGRGATAPITWIDEVMFVNNIQVIVPAALAAGTAARDEAAKSGQPYGTILTCTAGDTVTVEGRYGYELYTKGMRWTEDLFDLYDEKEVHEVVSKNSSGVYKLVVVEMNHRQLRYTDEWLRNKLEESLADGETGKRDFLNIWGTGGASSVLDPKDAERIKESEMVPYSTDISKDGYVINWYVDDKKKNEYKTRALVASLDTSDAIGSDDIFLTVRDPLTGATVAAGMYNETNTITFSKFLFEIITDFSQILFIIERRSTATSIIDNLLLLCQSAGVDPFKHIFNWVVNDKDLRHKDFEMIDMPMSRRDPEVYIRFRKDFGFATSGGGRTSRKGLYGETFNNSVKYTGSVVRDIVISKQLRELVKKNGRIDHTASGSDDAVISWLLGYWFLSKAENVDFYGHDVNSYLSSVSLNSTGLAEDMEKEAEQAKRIKQHEEITSLLAKVRSENNHVKASLLAIKIKQLLRLVNIDESDVMRIEQEIQNSLKNKMQRRGV